MKPGSFCDAISFRRANATGLGFCSPFSVARICRRTLSFEEGCVLPYNWKTDKQLQSVSVQSSSPDQEPILSLSFLSDVKDLWRLRGLYLSGFCYEVLRLPSVTGELVSRQFLFSTLIGFKC